MAVTTTYLNVNGNWTDDLNWDPSVPATGDTVIVAKGDKDIITNVDQSATVDDVILKIGEEFSGTIGTASSPLKFGTTSGAGTLEYNAPLCRAFHFFPAAMATYKIFNTHPNAYACHLVDGAITNIHCIRGQGIRLGSALNPTNVYLYPRSAAELLVTIESGCTIATLIRQLGGKAVCSAAIPTLEKLGGQWDHVGDTTNDITALRLWRGLFNWESPGSTITNAYVYGGKLDGSRDPGSKTVTNGEVWEGGTVDLDNGVGTITQTNAWTVYGGNNKGLISPDIVVYPELIGQRT